MHRLGELETARRDLADAAARLRAQGTLDRAFNSDLALARVLAELKQTDEAEALLASVETARAGRMARSGVVTPKTVRAELLLAKGELTQAARAVEEDRAAMGFPAAKGSPPIATALRVAARARSVEERGCR